MDNDNQLLKNELELTYELELNDQQEKALVFTDLLFNLNLNEARGIGWFILWLLGSGGDGIQPKGILIRIRYFEL
jgi:hypothetical protein